MRLTPLLFVKKLAKSAILATEKEIEIKAPWGKITALAWGEQSSPPIFLCHGRLDACTSFRPLVTVLPDKYYYVSIDLPGNGRSDQLSGPGRYTKLDFLPAIVRMADHLKWDKFLFVGHSLGAMLGKIFDIVYPGRLTGLVELDPMPSYITCKNMSSWYQYNYGHYYEEGNFSKYTSGIESAPDYTYDEVQQKLMKARGISEEFADYILERSLAPTKNGKFRLTFDQRMKRFAVYPYTMDQLNELYSSSKAANKVVLASETKDQGYYDGAILNNTVTIRAGHDLHLQATEQVAAIIKEFLLSIKY